MHTYNGSVFIDQSTRFPKSVIRNANMSPMSSETILPVTLSWSIVRRTPKSPKFRVSGVPACTNSSNDTFVILCKWKNSMMKFCSRQICLNTSSRHPEKASLGYNLPSCESFLEPSRENSPELGERNDFASVWERLTVSVLTVVVIRSRSLSFSWVVKTYFSVSLEPK